MSILLLFLLVMLIYAALTSFIAYQFKKEGCIANSADASTSFSVSFIVAARNEEENIARCIESIKQQVYEKLDYEIIIVNDHSSDRTKEVVQEIEGVSLYNLPDQMHGKKRALDFAVSKASKSFIFFTDADCTHSSSLIKKMADFQSIHSSKLIAGPVFIKHRNRFIFDFQHYDFLASLTITAAGFQIGDPFVCNGACLLVERTSFNEVGGYEGNFHIPSGDDVFLLQKMKRAYPGRVHFIKNKEVYVHTNAVSNWRDFYFQRLRWGTKQSAMKSTRSNILMLMFFLTSLVVLISPFFMHESIVLFISIVIFKFLADGLLIIPTAFYYGQRIFPFWYILSFLIHMIYLQLVVVSSLVYKRFDWKGRRMQN